MASSPATATAAPAVSLDAQQTPRRTGPLTRAAAARQRLAGAYAGGTPGLSSPSAASAVAASPFTPASRLKSEKENIRPMTTTAVSRRRVKSPEFERDVLMTPSKPMTETPLRRVTRSTRKTITTDTTFTTEQEKEEVEEEEAVENAVGDAGDDVDEEAVRPLSAENGADDDIKISADEKQPTDDSPASEDKDETEEPDEEQDSLLSPSSDPSIPAAIMTTASSYQETASRKITSILSRSPSPVGLIPLHERYRRFIHRHEIPRKLLHVSIGFVTLNFYRLGIQTFQITPWLMSALLPIATLDIFVGALMRESEVDGYNGVIWYLLGAWTVLYFFPKDVGVMGVLLLSWCDTAASTFGRAWGKYTPKLRKGKSLAGTAAAFVTGVLTAIAFWGWFVPTMGSFPTDPEHAFMFEGRLCTMPSFMRAGGEDKGLIVDGYAALGIMSVWTGLVAAVSELIDIFGWDDNLTIPVLSGVGLWGFLKVFG
ncbi:phosphatidate cytidylyltransferase family protein [Ascosphaera apis ARSEF 7405]|uniref:Phosphatidate cytidylyltransferase family protein n=1 Tax=Ascosphaera apis ARSEF 7405 TaxID=392613 RepID=A0A166PFJ8_9EURO|nr:phosphatidate cytidylyltransferase family protein [Ascosphaera apis ARSEF 7405]